MLNLNLGEIMDTVSDSLSLMIALIGIVASLTFEWFKLNHAAKTKFRAAFADELSALSELQIVDWSNVFHLLRSAYPKHEAAYHEYLNALVCSPFKKKKLQRRWMAYRGEYWGELEDQEYRLAHFVSITETEEREMRNKAIQLIKELIA